MSFEETKASKSQADELHLYRFELRAGYLVTDDRGNEWEVTGYPSVYNPGKMHQVRVQKMVGGGCACRMASAR
jgi:hypothetical protein